MEHLVSSTYTWALFPLHMGLYPSLKGWKVGLGFLGVHRPRGRPLSAVAIYTTLHDGLGGRVQRRESRNDAKFLSPMVIFDDPVQSLVEVLQ
jgi:hypothetical protein